jgi:hypothetical protein
MKEAESRLGRNASIVIARSVATKQTMFEDYEMTLGLLRFTRNDGGMYLAKFLS